MRYPDFLSKNGTIGYVAPSFGCSIEPYHSAFLNALKKLEARGHSAVLGPNCFEGKGIGISNDPKLCARELEEAYLSTESEVLISCGGGEMMCEVMSEVDWELLKSAKPKWFEGFSDNTNFTFLSATLLDTAAIYGACAASYGMEPWHPVIEETYQLLRGQKMSLTGYDKWELEGLKDAENPLLPYNVTEPTRMKIFEGEEASMEGRLLGGCMDCLVNLLGTRFDKVQEFCEKYAEDGIVWFLEACELNPMAIRRAIWQMKEAGWFAHTKGFLIGRPYMYGQDFLGLDQYRAVTDLLEEFGVPIVMDVDLGHLPPSLPIVCGAKGSVTVKNNELSLTYEWK